MPGELVHKPAVDGTEAAVAAFGPGAGLRGVFQEPGELGSRKIWIEHQPGDRPGPRFEPSALQRGAAICGSPVLPHDRTVDGFAAVSQPQPSCLPLVGDSDRGNGLRLDPGVAECSLDAMEGRAPDFVQVVLHPARLGEILSELAVRRAENAQLGIDHQDVRAGGALIDGQDVFLRPHLNPPGGRQSPVDQPIGTCPKNAAIFSANTGNPRSLGMMWKPSVSSSNSTSGEFVKPRASSLAPLADTTWSFRAVAMRTGTRTPAIASRARSCSVQRS